MVCRSRREVTRKEKLEKKGKYLKRKPDDRKKELLRKIQLYSYWIYFQLPFNSCLVAFLKISLQWDHKVIPLCINYVLQREEQGFSGTTARWAGILMSASYLPAMKTWVSYLTNLSRNFLIFKTPVIAFIQQICCKD